LNNLYSLAIDKSDKAPDLILKLSDLMKYFLYETGKEFQELENEITHIKDYIEIEKLRYKDSLNISFNVNGKIKNKKIRPLLLIPLVENAFKHGARSCSVDCYITIDLKVEKSILKFRVENSMAEIEKKLKEQIGGIGLSNIKKRLELNYGEGNFDFKNFKEKNKYIAELKIKLKT
jgi:LytS/YehU family sensor histidine kinase